MSDLKCSNPDCDYNVSTEMGFCNKCGTHTPTPAVDTSAEAVELAMIESISEVNGPLIDAPKHGVLFKSVRFLSQERDSLKDALERLYAVVKGECPSLLGDDGGVCLEILVDKALSRTSGEK